MFAASVVALTVSIPCIRPVPPNVMFPPETVKLLSIFALVPTVILPAKVVFLLESIVIAVVGVDEFVP